MPPAVLSPDRLHSRWFVAALAGLFFCSGASALIYQVLWLRTLGWVFGVTVYAASTVWASFMAGLGIGSFVTGLIGDRIRTPLLWFAAAEILTGVTAASTPWLLQVFQDGYVSVYPSLPNSLTALTFVRLGIAFAVLVVPTTLMGATLPLVVKSAQFSSGGLGTHLGLLYGSNTAGAIVGTIATGLHLIPDLGIHNTFVIAASLNILVGVCAIVLSGVARKADLADITGDDTVASSTPVERDAQHHNGRLVLVLVVFAVSGAVALALEVVWFRVLTLFLRPTVYAFAVMLATILGGIAIGSYFVTPLLNRRVRWFAVLASLELATGIVILLSFRPLFELPRLSGALTPYLSRVMPEYLVYPLSGSLLAIFPAALLMGAAFPIGLRVWTAAADADPRTVARRVGIFYSLNVAGGIVGSLAGGFVLLPFLGSRTSLAVLAAVSLVSGLALLLVAEWRRTTRVIVGAAASVVFVLAAVHAPDPFDEFVRQRYPRERVLWREEGVEATVVVHENSTGVRSMTVNGNHQASTDGTTTYIHRRIGHLPMALHPAPRTALVIGLGGGATGGAVSIHDRV